MQKPLFDVFERTDTSPALHSEDSFHFLNRAAGVFWERIREKLDSWYAAFPDLDGDLRRRFHLADPRQHYAVWWELYLHALLSELGFDLTVHPDVPGTSGHPDFLAERGGASFYVEAVTVFSGIVATGRRGRLEAAVQDVIETIDPHEIMVSLRHERVGQSMPRKVAITGPIEAWLATLNAHEMLAAEPGGIVPDKKLIEIDDWLLELRPMAVPVNRRGCPSHRMIAAGPGMAGYTNDARQLGRALTRKKKQLGTPDKPLVVAALATNGFVDQNVVENALFGSEAVRFNVQTGESSLVRSPDGVWVGKRGPAAKRMSALLMGVGILPNTIARSAPQLWHHFDPTFPLEVDLPFSSVRVVDQELEIKDATRSPAEVFGVAHEWPGPEPAFPRCLHRPEDHCRKDAAG